MDSSYFGNDVEIFERKIDGKDQIVKWDWKNFQSTQGYPVNKNLISWVIGQDQALSECYLCLDEWTHKLKSLRKAKWYERWQNKDNSKPLAKTVVSPGPYLLLLGDPGTGKSLIGRALADKLTTTYQKEKIELFDVLCWKNKALPSEPKISIHKAEDGKRVIQKENLKEVKRKFLSKIGIKSIQILLVSMGLFLLGLGLYLMVDAWLLWESGGQINEFYDFNFSNYFVDKFMGLVPITFIPAGSLIFFGVLIWWFSRIGGLSNVKGISGSQRSDVPKLIVNNRSKSAAFIDATGHKSSQLFGSIAWDPYQTGGLGTPEHQRVTAGDVHQASFGILYIDEIKNLSGQEATTLLTVLEDGQLPITIRSQFSGAGTSAMAVSTEPVPAMTFLVASGNFDSIPQIHPALMDRIYGYGKVVRMNNDMPNNCGNRRKYVQFIAQEVQRFNLIPFSKNACEELIEEGRRRSNKKKALTTRFRPLISIIKTAATLAMNEREIIVEKKYIREAIENHCKSIQQQMMEHQMSEQSEILEILPQGVKSGQIHGLAVIQDLYSGEKTGCVLSLRASMVKKNQLHRDYPLKGYYKVTGVIKGAQKFMTDSISKVRSVILQKYGVDIAQDYLTHIDFAQSSGVDGSSAGVTMAILLCSLIEGKSVRQDVAVTGDLNIGNETKIPITAIGGVYEKIKAAETWGFKKVIIPKKNYEYSIDLKDYSIKVEYGETLDDYLAICLE